MPFELQPLVLSYFNGDPAAFFNLQSVFLDRIQLGRDSLSYEYAFRCLESLIGASQDLQSLNVEAAAVAGLASGVLHPAHTHSLEVQTPQFAYTHIQQLMQGHLLSVFCSMLKAVKAHHALKGIFIFLKHYLALS